MRRVLSRRIVLLLLLVSLSWSQAAAPEAAPELKLPNLAGDVQALSGLRGKIVVLNFFATWCLPCQHEMPLLREAQARYGAKDVVVIGVSIDDATTMPKLPKFLKKNKVEFGVWTGGTVEHIDAFGLAGIVPSTVFIDRDGSIVGRVQGELRKRQFFTRLDWLTGDRAAPAPPAVEKNL